ncbi:uncharacterized protein C1orf112 homolog [Colias croceus]|uniref:uncharacterized protein C1orf112 homolog n=1 Tax=Colias crocea TaxID=72248 RepID=UPI001E27E568|nr:uncharacterized protein C1orf112 homolog [Colias croceus]
MDTETYKTLLHSLKSSLCKDKKLISVKYFNEVLRDCETCIYQCLNAIASALEDTNLEILGLCEHIEDAVCLLQMLSSYIINVIESFALACCSMKTYPTITGNIILSVFTHCKDSECLYGVYISKVEKQLKDLFRTCHELQLTYLMSMEKHYTFDLSETYQLDILLEALDINLKIGDVAQTLDVKTMAEQWKAYTAICEKYSKYLLDKDIYNKCTKLFIEMIRNNMKTGLEVNDDKAILRSVKVASFGIRILSKLCNIFKNATCNDHEGILDILIYLFTFNTSYLDLKQKSKLSRQVESNIILSLEVLLNQLVNDTKFLYCICNINDSKLQGDAFFGYVLLLAAIMTKLLNINNMEVGDIKIRILKHLFSLLPSGHTWFNMGLKLKLARGTEDQTYSLFAYLLTVTVAFAKTLNSEEFAHLERIIFEALLNTDCYSAVFAANLWELLLRSCDPRLLSNTLMSLVKVYQKLGNIKSFHSSPQKIYILYTLRRLFQQCSQQDKLLIYKQYNILDKQNVWIGLKISNLPSNVQYIAEQLVFVKLQKMVNGLRVDDDEDIDCMIQLINLVATCKNNDNNIMDLLDKMWGKACPKCNYDNKEFDQSSTWYFRFIEAIIILTESLRERIPKHVKIKILHIISRIVQSENLDLIYLSFPTFCALYDHHLDIQSDILHDVFEKVLINADFALRQYVFNVIKNSPLSKEFNNIVQQDSLQDVLTEFNEYKNTQNDIKMLKNQFENVERNVYTHKCLKSQVCNSVSERSQSKSNFDLADIDSLFDNDSDNEPSSKRVKFNVNEIEDLILRIEEESTLLCDLKENILSAEHKRRLSNVCVKLRNIIEH